MEGFNKAISFILGLVVVVVFIAVLTGRINLKNRIPSFNAGIFSRTTPTPTTPKPVGQQTSTVVLDNQNKTQNDPNGQENINYHQYQTNNNASLNKNTTNIPNTGPELLFPIALSGLSMGLIFKKISHK